MITPILGYAVYDLDNFDKLSPSDISVSEKYYPGGMTNTPSHYIHAGTYHVPPLGSQRGYYTPPVTF